MDDKFSFDITTNLREEVAVDAAIAIIQDVIKQRGFCLIERNDKFEIKLINESQYIGPIVTSNNIQEHIKKNNFITYIMELKYIDINDLIPIIQTIISRDGMMNNIRGSNILIISGFSRSIEALTSLIETLDKPEKGYKVKLYELKYIDPIKLTNIINMFSGLNLMTTFIQSARSSSTQLNTDESSIEPLTGRILAIPLPNTMKIILASNLVNFENLDKLIKKIDIPDKTGIIRLNYITVEEAKQLLNQIYKEQILVNVYKEGNSIIITYSSDELFSKVNQLLKEIDKPFTDSRLHKQTYIFKLKNTKLNLISDGISKWISLITSTYVTPIISDENVINVTSGKTLVISELATGITNINLPSSTLFSDDLKSPDVLIG